jgi:CcmD family protein
MAAVTLTAVLALPASALAGAAGQSAPGESNLGFLLAGLVVAWAGFFAYTIYLSRKNRDLRRELDDLKRTLAERNERQPRDRQ